MKKILPLVGLLLMLSACTEKTQPPLERSSFMLDTVVSITLYDWEDEETLSRAMTEMNRLEGLLSVSKQDSDLARLAHAAGDDWVDIAPETQEVLEAAKAYWTLTDGYFDVTAGPLIDLWNIGSAGGHYPSSEELTQALSLISAQRLQVEDGRAYLEQPGMEAHLGGIAKGYIADRIKALLLEEGVTSAVIDLGGNVLVIGEKPTGEPFRIGIRAPMTDSGMLEDVVRLRDKSLVTAGVYERYFEYEGRAYHHILDPFTGFPADTGLVSVTVLAEDSMAADALATSCLLLGETAGLALVTELPDTEALFLREDGTVACTEGFSAYYDE